MIVYLVRQGTSIRAAWLNADSAERMVETLNRDRPVFSFLGGGDGRGRTGRRVPKAYVQAMTVSDGDTT